MLSWNDYYKLAVNYYNKYGDLNMPTSFKTLDGKVFDSNGFNLGEWLFTQKVMYYEKDVSVLYPVRIKLLDNIGIDWNIVVSRWDQSYALARLYFDYYGNLDVTQNFKTSNGFEYDEDGYCLGLWIQYQRQSYWKEKPNRCLLSEKKIELLEKIGMIWRKKGLKWNEYYELAKIYYQHYGNLDIPYDFKTNNGYEINEKEGTNLGIWLSRQRSAYKMCMNDQSDSELDGDCLSSGLTDLQIKLLNDIGIVWDLNEQKWMNNYNLAKAYYEQHGDLNIPIDYVTEDKVKLGVWVSNQRTAYKGIGVNKITTTQIKLLEDIGMYWNPNYERWCSIYNLAKAYYEYYGDLNVHQSFKTNNGYLSDLNGVSLGNWISSQRLAYAGKGNRACLTDLQIKKLDDIHIEWFRNNDNKSQCEVITDSNKKRKQIEILNRFKTCLNKIPSDVLLDDIGFYFMEQLNGNSNLKRK